MHLSKSYDRKSHALNWLWQVDNLTRIESWQIGCGYILSGKENIR
jgi:hypothetical protein